MNIKEYLQFDYTEDEATAFEIGYDAGLHADQWHYPSKGEYPTESGKYLVVWRGEYGEHIDIDQWSDGKWWYMGEVKAWQYIIPPKEEA